MSKDNDLVVRTTATPRPKPAADAPLGLGRQLTDHAYCMRWTKRRSWQGMTIVDRDDLPAVRPTSAGLHYGQAVSDGLNAYRMTDGSVAVYRPDSHIKRLNNAARRMALPQVDFDRLWRGVRALVELDAGWLPEGPGAALHLRVVLTGNGATLDLAPAEEGLLTVLAAVVRQPGTAERPARAMVVDDYVRAWPGGTGDINAVGGYGQGVVPREIAANYGYDHVLWTGAGPQRRIQQVGDMNVFFVIDGVLTTPALDGTVLPGVTRDSIIKLARDEGARVDERPIGLDEVLRGISDGRVTECFATGTVEGVVPIDGLGFQSEEYRLPAGTTVAAHHRAVLDGIRSGALVDRFGWMRRLTEVSPVTA
jgi:branched-chain amino acid aminotransferase